MTVANDLGMTRSQVLEMSVADYRWQVAYARVHADKIRKQQDKQNKRIQTVR